MRLFHQLLRKGLCILAVGVAVTALFDVALLLRASLTPLGFPDYAMVGRWLLHMLDGQFVHDSIRSAPARFGETSAGWIAHYAAGVFYTAIYLALVDRKPKFGMALGFGGLTALVPFLIMQPAMGAGFAALDTSNPALAQLRTLSAHLIFGGCLFLAPWAEDALRRSANLQ